MIGRVFKSAAAIGAAALIAGSGAYALAASSGDTISVCVNHKDGALYKAKRCARYDRKLTWNQQGPIGPRGANGLQGPQGPPGPQGSPGAQGIAGPATTIAPSGSTQRGVLEINQSADSSVGTSVSFPLELASAPTVDEQLSGQTDSHCSGTPADPTAAPGYMCVYIRALQNISTGIVGYPLQPQKAGDGTFGASTFGVEFTAPVTAPGDTFAAASWAVTAP